MAYLLGIDVGTTGTKALLTNEKGRICASVTEEYPLYAPRPLWSEQNPEDWWQATARAIRRLLRTAKVKGAQVAGLGLSGQMHGSVFLDRSHKVLRPAILWNDQRTAEECAEITATIGARRLIELVSNPALTGFTAPKVLWVRKHEPRVYEKTSIILLPKDYVRFRLTGEFATEVSDASGTLLFDVRHRRWSRETLSALQIDPGLLPACYESPVVSGRVSAAAGEETGLAAGTPVVGGGGDQAAGAVGNGIVTTGVISATLGTSGVVFAFADEVKTDPLGRAHTFCHAVPGKWHVMGVILAAGGSFRWFRDTLGQDELREARKRRVDPYEVLCEEAAEAAPGCEGLFFLPYLTGERTPHADPHARACWVGITPRTRKPELIRSLLEGATYAMRDSLEIIKEMGIPVRQIRASGGGARSPFWRQLQADVYNHPVVTINASEGPAFGVALLAGVGAGVWGSVEDACLATIKVTSTTRVNRSRAELYERHYQTFRSLYPALKSSFADIAHLVG
jgi:xylulokinase